MLKNIISKFAAAGLTPLITFGFFFSLFSTPSFAAECSISSPNRRASLIELYTSEGCSSCPPADKWLSSLESRGIRSELFVPLAFHVDYWNYIGWVDRFAQSRFTSRQRSVAARDRLSTIYTPQVVLNGKDYRAWRRQNIPALVKAISETKPDASIQLKSSQSADNRIHINVTAKVPNKQDRNNAQLYIAIYENHLSSSVASGENSGRFLSHDYVVRNFSRPYSIETDRASMSVSHEVHMKSEWKPQDLGIAVFIQNQRTGKVYQAVSMPLICNS